MKQLLIETHIFQPIKSTLNESLGDDNKNLVVEGILATVEVENGNGRYYSRELWERELGKYAEVVKQRRSMGELDHPESEVINLKNVSHLIKEFWWEGKEIMGKIEILPTPSGNILAELLRNKVVLGVSSRGLGSLEERDGIMEVQDDFALLCFDFVSTPSNPGSYFHTLNENKKMKDIKNTYKKVNEILTEILCSKGTCPTF